MIPNVQRTASPEMRRPCVPGLGLALVVAAGLTAGCHILDVSNPDIVLPGSLNGAAALPTIRAGAIGDFAIAYSGSGAQGSGGTTEGLILLGGMLADELINTETFPDRILADARQPQIESGTLQTVFRNLHKARRSAEIAAQKFREFADTTVDGGLSETLWYRRIGTGVAAPLCRHVRGCPVGSAWAARSTPARSRWPTAPPWRPPRSNGCSPTTRPRACCATWTRVTTWRPTRRRRTACGSP